MLLLVCRLLLLVVAVAASSATTVHIDGQEYVPPPGWQVALLSDDAWVTGTSDAVYESFDAMDAVAYGDAARTAYVASLYPDWRRVLATSPAAWLTAVTNLTLEAAADVAGGKQYRGVQWAITGNKGVSGCRIRLWFIPSDTVVNIAQYYENTWIPSSPRSELTTFENWVYSGVLLWCSGHASCGSINATVGPVAGSSSSRWRLRAAASGTALSTSTSCAGRHLIDDTPVPVACSCYALESGTNSLFNTTQCYACKGEGESRVWNVPSASCVQADFDPARAYAGSVFSAGPPRPLVHATGQEIVAVWHRQAPQVTYATTTHVPGVWVMEDGDTGPVPQPALGNATLHAAPGAPWDGNALVTQYAYNACIALGPTHCTTITWTPNLFIDVNVTYEEDGRTPIYTTARVVARVDFVVYTTALFFNTYAADAVVRPSPSTNGFVYTSLDGTAQRHTAQGYAPHDAFILAPAVSSTTDGFITLCSNSGAQVGCGRVLTTGNPHTTNATLGDVFNPPWATSACSPRVAHRTYNPWDDTCTCDWQLSFVGQLLMGVHDDRTEACGDCTDGMVRSAENGQCTTCMQAAGCNENNTVTAHCTGDYHDYVCDCAPGFDPDVGCSRCADNHVLVDGDTCVPCATYLGCSAVGTADAECAYASPTSSRLGVAVCRCAPGYTGDDCGQCDTRLGVFRPASNTTEDDTPCVHARFWCGIWGVPDLDTGTCTCSHGRTGKQCDECDGEALCGPGGSCQHTPGAREWCVCGPSALGVRAWWNDTPQTPCTACPPGYLPNNWTEGVTSGCSEAHIVCPGITDVAASTITGSCRCLPGWAQNTGTEACTVCAPGHVGTECVSCSATLCGGPFWDTCNDTAPCTCSPGRAGPPCDGTCLPGYRRVVITEAGIDTCSPCPTGCPDPHCALGPTGRHTVCVCPTGTTGDECTLCRSGWVVSAGGNETCVPCPTGGCLNGVCVAGGLCRCLPGFDPATQCAACLREYVAIPAGGCRLCVGDGASCGSHGWCRAGSGGDDNDDGCACDDGYAWSGGTCVPCDPAVTTGRLSGCVPCPHDGCPIGSTCAGVLGPDGWVATCGCTQGLVRPSGATTGACSAPRGSPLTGIDAYGRNSAVWYTTISFPTVLAAHIVPGEDAGAVATLLTGLATGTLIFSVTVVVWVVRRYLK